MKRTTPPASRRTDASPRANAPVASTSSNARRATSALSDSPTRTLLTTGICTSSHDSPSMTTRVRTTGRPTHGERSGAGFGTIAGVFVDGGGAMTIGVKSA